MTRTCVTTGVVVLLLMTVGCGLLAEQVPITEAALSDDGRTLELGVASCNAQHTVEVEDQAADQVRVTVTARGGDGNDCMDVVTLVLQKELNGRTLVDASTGDVVALQ